MPPHVYSYCFRELKKYCESGDTTDREALMDAIYYQLTGKNGSQLSPDQIELDEYTL